MKADPIRCEHGAIVAWSVFAYPAEPVPPVEYCAPCTERVAAAEVVSARAFGPSPSTVGSR